MTVRFSILALALFAALAAPAGAALPTVSPAPQSIAPAGRDVALPEHVRVVVDDATDGPARRLLERVLRSHGVKEIARAPTAPLTVRLGSADRPDVRAALAGTAVPSHPEGYALRVDGRGPRATIALGGVDGDGQYYAVQTLRQLLVRAHGGWRIAGASVSDYPSMPLRGTIEGFYGDPWTAAERLDQMRFYGDVKANTYVYAPKDDPYHRDRWREPYPADQLAQLRQLVAEAVENHVRFTFALSPGVSICYSSAADRAALLAKLQAVYDLGARTFSIPLDDISYTRWNCDADAQAYGPPGRTAAATAQVDLLNDVQRSFVETHAGTKPLQMVPTEYGDLTETSYKQVLRSTLDDDVVVMWTGTDVVPPSITNAQADAASQLFGRNVFVWDNYPVNDYGNTAGRLLLAPYDQREPGLSEHLSGIVANPMNQAAASKVAVFGVADFTWNDRAYDPSRSWPAAMRYLSGGDEPAAKALLVFADLEHLAPTFGATPWQPQAPALAGRVDAFWRTWNDGRHDEAIARLRAYAHDIAMAPARIRAGAVDPPFVGDARPWLDATALWGRAVATMLDALAAHERGDLERAHELRAASDDLAAQAAAIRVDPPENRWGAAPVKVGDGVLDTFLTDAGEVLGGGAPLRIRARTRTGTGCCSGHRRQGSAPAAGRAG